MRFGPLMLASLVLAACDGPTGPGGARRLTELTSVIAGPDRFVGVGGAFWATEARVPGSDSTLIVTSTDGTTWEHAGATVPGWLFDVAHGGGRYVAVGSRFADDAHPARFTPVMLRSADGLAWEAAHDTTARQWTSVAHGAGTFVAVAFHVPTLAAVIATSQDGATWIDRAAAAVLSPRVTFGNGRFVLWGEAPGLGVSTDGVVWTDVPLDSVNLVSAIAFVDGRFLGSGVFDCCFGEVPGMIGAFDLSSPDGASWTLQRRTDPAQRFFGFGYGSGRYVALGGHELFASPDGASWERTHEAGGYYGTIAFRDGRFVVAGRTVLTSTDGEDWADISF